MSRDRAPARQTGPARSRTRRTWYGYGTLTSVEKSGFGRFLHDVSYVFADVSIPALPVLFAIVATASQSGYGPVGAGLVAWATTTVVGTAIRGGWIRPLATPTLGWVSVTPSLVALRVLYYNSLLGLAAFGSVAVASAVGIAPLSLALAFLASLLGTLSFPRIAESTYGALRRV